MACRGRWPSTLAVRQAVPFFLGLVGSLNQEEEIPSWWHVGPLFQAPVMNRAVCGLGDPGLRGKLGAPRDCQLKCLSLRIWSRFQIIPSRLLSVRPDTGREPQGPTTLTAEGAGNGVTEDPAMPLLSASCFLVGRIGGHTGCSLGKGLQMRL